MTVVDVPPQVATGTVTGRFVQFVADTADAGALPDEVPLTGAVVLSPRVQVTQWPTTVPPRLAILYEMVCPVIGGDLCAPGTLQPGVSLLATDQPEGQPTTVQWRASFDFDLVPVQPHDVIFDVPAGGTVDLAMVVPVTPEPGTVTVVSHTDAVAAEGSADAAAASATQAATSATQAGQSETNAATSRVAAQDAAIEATGAAQDAGESETFAAASATSAADSALAAADSADAAQVSAVAAATSAAEAESNSGTVLTADPAHAGLYLMSASG